MLEKIGTGRFESVSAPCPDVLTVLEQVLLEKQAAVVAEVGVGIGATTKAVAERLDNQGALHIFDYADSVSELTADLANIGYTNVVSHGNTRRLLDDYCWNLIKLVRAQRADGRAGTFDFIFLDGSHTFIHEGPASLLAIELVHVGGFILFDDVNWTFAKSPTVNPDKKSKLHEWFTDEQLSTPQIRLVCEMFFERNPSFTRITKNISSGRALYKKIGRHGFGG